MTDEIRDMAIKLFEAGQKEKSRQGKEIWGTITKWKDLPSESVAVWDAVAICACKTLKKKGRQWMIEHRNSLRGG